MLERTIVDKPEKSDRDSRRYLRGKPLTSRKKWFALAAAYVTVCILGFVAVIVFAHGWLLAAGITVVAFLAGGLFSSKGSSYDRYRKEWELANGPDLHGEE